ncbi:DUF4251 domain-containing protein [Winogradskyella sp.]|uniref:DUF4251 domain-containing protein n=1 Tax=Winogradskyella sp. TaxID=1883156 RepID=UPI0026342259|nr:DUF4251 domain-containing protein [Winogradskyella sp.]
MKNLIALTLILSISFSSVCFSQQQSSEKERAQAIYLGHKALIETQNFQFVANWVFRDDARKEVPVDRNTIKISQSNLAGLLASFGNNEEAIVLNGKINDYSTLFNDDEQQIIIKIKTDVYDIKIDIKSNGKAFLVLKANNLQSMTYRGVIAK